MALEIPIPDDKASFSENIIIGGLPTTLTLNFNSTDQKWRIKVQDNNENVLIQGIPLTPNKSPTKKYSLSYFDNGNLWVIRKVKTDKPLGYDNFGFNKDYGLFYLTAEEEEALGI